jgi:hypothetical protein
MPHVTKFVNATMTGCAVQRHLIRASILVENCDEMASHLERLPAVLKIRL